MASSFHKITIIGNLGREPEMRYTPSGQPVTTLSVATTRVFMRGEDKVEETTWFRVTIWGKQAETAQQYLHKGNKVHIEARLNPDPSGNPRIWTNKEGAPAASYEVTAETINFLSGGQGNGAAEVAAEEAPVIPF